MATEYQIIDKDSRTIVTIPDVLTPVALTSVSTTSSSNEVTVASTTGVFAGMPVSIPGVPPGSFVHAVKSATVLELWRSVWDTSAGTWSTTAANANATASASGLTGRAYGYHPTCLIAQTYALGMWRNLHDSNSSNGSATVVGAYGEYVAHHTYGNGVAVVPTTGSVASGLYTMTAADARLSDNLASTPVKRHNGEIWGVRPFVQTGGMISHVPANPDWSSICTSAV